MDPEDDDMIAEAYWRATCQVLEKATVQVDNISTQLKSIEAEITNKSKFTSSSTDE